MKNALYKVLLLVLAGAMNVASASESLVLMFQDSEETGRVIKVVSGRNGERSFSNCAYDFSQAKTSGCEALHTIKINKFTDQERYLQPSEAGAYFMAELSENIGGVVGGAAGAVGSAAVGLTQNGVGKLSVKQKAMAVIILGVGTAVGNQLGVLIGDIIDGFEFGALDSAAIIRVFSNQSIVDMNSSEVQMIEDLSQDEYTAQLNRAIGALRDRIGPVWKRAVPEETVEKLFLIQ